MVISHLMSKALRTFVLIAQVPVHCLLYFNPVDYMWIILRHFCVILSDFQEISQLSVTSMYFLLKGRNQ